MDRKRIEEEHIVESYLADRLSPQDVEAFEAYYTRHPDMVREIELALRLKEGLATLQDRRQLQALVQRRQWRWAVPVSVAAAILVAVGGVWTWHALPTTPSLVAQPRDLVAEQGAPIPLAGKYLLVRVRGAAAVTEIPLPAERSALELQVVPGLGADGAPYELSLARVTPDGNESRIASLAGLTPASDGLVHAWIDSARLQPGRYAVELSPRGGDGPASVDRFLIELR